MTVGFIRSIAAQDGGQSLVEVALALPILLLIVLGIVDVGHAYAYKTATTNAAREAAIYAARNPQATPNAICQHARDELGAGPLIGLNPCADGPITVVCSRAGTPPTSCNIASWDPMPLFQPGGGADVTVTVLYDVPTITGYLLGRVFPFRVDPNTGNPVNLVTVGATAAFVGLGE